MLLITSLEGRGRTAIIPHRPRPQDLSYSPPDSASTASKMFRLFISLLLVALCSAQYYNPRFDNDLVPAMPHTIRSPAGIRLPVNSDYIQSQPIKRHSILDNLYGIGYVY